MRVPYSCALDDDPAFAAALHRCPVFHSINHRENALTAPAHAPAIPHVRARRVTADPHTGRATERYVNAAHCRRAGGSSVEAHLAAVAANALPEHMTQLDHLLRCGGSVCACAFVRVCVCVRAHASAVFACIYVRVHVRLCVRLCM